MKKYSITGALIFLLALKLTTLFSQSTNRLVWAEEFDYEGKPDSTKWSYNIGNGCPELCGWGNNELQYYTNDPSNVMVKDGKLYLTARKENTEGYAYSSGKLDTKEKVSWKYGRLEIRAKLPQGQGIWPALWMLGDEISTVGWPKCGEIDIVELIGGSDRDNEVHGTIHWDHKGSHASYGKPYQLDEGIFHDDFHVFSVVWDETKIQWFVDGQQYNEADISPEDLDEFRNNFFLIMNVAVGGNWPGSPDASTVFPQQMVVDYIRVYQ